MFSLGSLRDRILGTPRKQEKSQLPTSAPVHRVTTGRISKKYVLSSPVRNSKQVEFNVPTPKTPIIKSEADNLTESPEIDTLIDGKLIYPAALPHPIAEEVDIENNADWTEEENKLVEALDERGNDPLLHIEWKLDFPTLPDELFTEDKSKILIKNMYGSAYRGMWGVSKSYFFL
jgi:hypothetical protein